MTIVSISSMFLISLILFSVEINPNYKDKSFLLNNPNFLKLITEDVILDTLKSR